MSVFILSDKDAQGVFAALASRPDAWKYALLTDDERRDGAEHIERLESFVLALRSANYAAYARRYNETATPAPVKLSRRVARPSATGAYKLLRCYRYNAAESIDSDYGPVDPSHAITLERLERILGDLAQVIVEKTHEYESAAWGS